MAVTPVDGAAIARLRAELHGQVIAPGDGAYDEARRVWNGMVDRHPGVVVRPTGVADVRQALAVARDHDLLVAVRGGGHNAAGLGTCDGGLVIDLAALAGVRVDPVSRTARVGGGARFAALDHESQAFGLATTGGLVSTTGVGGFTLGGGFGWLGRRLGPACDRLIGADVVAADGSLLRAGADADSELLFGLRGGGGNFGVVTELEFALEPVGPTVFGGALFYPIERAPDLMRFWRGWIPSLPLELATMLAFVTGPPGDDVPADVRGRPSVAVVLCYTGTAEQGEREIAALRAFGPASVDLVGAMGYVDLQSMFDPAFPPGICSYWRSEYLDELRDDAIDSLCASYAARTSPLSQYGIEQGGGAIASPAVDSALGNRDHAIRVLVLGIWEQPDPGDEHIAWTRSVTEGIRAHGRGSDAGYLNYAGDVEARGPRAAYEPDVYARLQRLKARVDPGNLFRVNHNILPGEPA